MGHLTAMAETPAQENLRAERARMRDVKVASGVAIGSAIGALVANEIVAWRGRV